MFVTRVGNVTVLTPIVTGLKRISDLCAGLWVYGNDIPVDTQIQSVVTVSSKIILTNTPTGTASEALTFTTRRTGTYLEALYALDDIKKYIDERGDLIEFNLRNDSDIVRDAYNSIEKKTETAILFLRAFPVTHSPSDKQLEKAGLKQKHDVILYTAMKDWITAGYGFDDIRLDLKSTIKLQGGNYEVKEKSLTGQMNDLYGYISFGIAER
jgi:hypothetical protein